MAEASKTGAKDLRGEPLVLAHNEWRVTTKPGKLYFTFFLEPRAPFELPPFKNAIKKAYRLADHEPVLVEGRQLIVPRPILDPMATVVVVEIEGETVKQ